MKGIDHQAIRELITLYGYSFDRRDWPLQRSLFTDEIEMDFSASIGSGLITMAADDWVAGVQSFFENLPATQHIAYAQKIEVDGGDAYAVSLHHAQHHLPNEKGDPVKRMVGWYENWLVRGADGRWRLRKMVQHIDWNEGRPCDTLEIKHGELAICTKTSLCHRSHVVPDLHPLSEFSGKKATVTAVSGSPITVDGTQAGIYTVTWESLNDAAASARITDTPLLASNAILYAVDSVTMA